MHENIWAERVLNAKHRLLILTSHNNWFGVSFQPTMERSSKVSPKLSAKWIHRAERVRDWLGLTHGGKPNFFASCKILNLFNTQQPSLQVPKKHANWLDSPTESEENIFVKKNNYIMKLKDAGSTRKFARLWIFSRTAQRRHLRSTQRWRVGGCPVGGTPISSQGLPIRPSTSADVPTEAPLWDLHGSTQLVVDDDDRMVYLDVLMISHGGFSS